MGIAPPPPGRSLRPGSRVREQAATYAPSQLEDVTIRVVDRAFDVNKEAWKDTHEKFRRLYNFVRQNRPNRTDTSSDRNDIRVGMVWMVAEILHASIATPILGSDPIGELVDLANQPLPFAQDMERLIHLQVNDESLNLIEKLSLAILDCIILGGCSILPNWRRIIKRVFQEVSYQDFAQNMPITSIQEVEKLVVAGPDIDMAALWNTFPTAGIKNFNEAHEVIIRIEQMPVHKMREYEREGLFDPGKVDAFLGMVGHKSVDDFADIQPESQREKTFPDAGSAFDVLVYMGLFPLYKYHNYIDDSGYDCSKDEVQCIIIKPVDTRICFKIDRNPYFNQEVPHIMAKYAQIQGEPWPIGPIEAAEDVLVHYNYWFNIIQDGADLIVYPDEIVPEAADEGEIEQDGPMRRYHVSNQNLKDGVYIKKEWADPGVAQALTVAYKQLEITQTLVQEVTGVLDLIKGKSDRQKTAKEVGELAERVNIRFRNRVLYIESTLLRPVLNWMLSMNAQNHRDIEWLMRMLSDLQFNPFQMVDPTMPNNMTRWKLSGALRAADSLMNAQKLEHLLALSLKIPPGPDKDGRIVTMAHNQILIDLARQSQTPNVDDYIIPPDPKQMMLIDALGGGGGQGNQDQVMPNIMRNINQDALRPQQ